MRKQKFISFFNKRLFVFKREFEQTLIISCQQWTKHSPHQQDCHSICLCYVMIRREKQTVLETI